MYGATKYGATNRQRALGLVTISHEIDGKPRKAVDGVADGLLPDAGSGSNGRLDASRRAGLDELARLGLMDPTAGESSDALSRISLLSIGGRLAEFDELKRLSLTDLNGCD